MESNAEFGRNRLDFGFLTRLRRVSSVHTITAVGNHGSITQYETRRRRTRTLFVDPARVVNKIVYPRPAYTIYIYICIYMETRVYYDVRKENQIGGRYELSRYE